MAGLGRAVKTSIVDELAGELTKRPNLIVASFGRLKASEADVLRKQLRASQARLILISRRLGTRSVERLQMPGLAELLQGSIGFVLPGEDVMPVAKTVVEFSKSHDEQLVIRGAVIEGQVLDRKRVEQLASLPPKPVLLAQVVGVLESPMADVIFTVERLIADLVYGLEQLAGRAPSETPQPPSTQEGTPS
ncbi:MAG: 50S ribosomal protein L10 [Candidatus Omnitrophica bacterium]|nr:50S ribosomal protein L10 [Candidatus Omnitrophota bacterium]